MPARKYRHRDYRHLSQNRWDGELQPDSRESVALLLDFLSFESRSSEPADPVELTESQWLGLLREALRHEVAPPLCARLLSKPGGAPQVPPKVSATLRDALHENAFRNLNLLAAVSEVLEMLRAKNIPAIVLKGAHLASCVYDSVAHRSMADVDLLVRKSDLARVEEILLGAGYGPKERPSIESEIAEQYHLTPFRRSGAVPVTIEVHWTLRGRDSPFEIETEGLWNRARPAVISGTGALGLAPEDLLLHLCVHSTYSHLLLFGIRGLYDVVMTLRRYAIDWEVLQRRAVRWRIERCVYLALSLAREHLGARVPAPVLQALAPESSHQMIEDTARALLFGDRVSARYAELWAAAGPASKLGLIFRSVLPSVETLRSTYPRAADSRAPYLYYPVRWLDLLRRYGRGTWRMLRGDQAAKATVRAESNRQALRSWLRSG